MPNGISADNARFYCHNGVPFVMGTTGGDREQLLADTQASGTYAVIAPNMGKQVGYEHGADCQARIRAPVVCQHLVAAA